MDERTANYLIDRLRQCEDMDSLKAVLEDIINEMKN